MKNHNWDIALSLCKQDIEFARKLVKALNPGLKVFFYEENQEELISESGPEKFANIFKIESRVVVVLSRNEWSNTYYTEIERNSIIDRTSIKNEGYNFLLIIPMEKDEIPSWYPSTRIYLNPRRFTIEELAKFIEFKVIEEGGKLKQITVEDRYQNLLNKIEEKKAIIELQHHPVAIEQARNEVNLLKEVVNQKIVFFENNIINTISSTTFHEHSNLAYCQFGEYMLQCNINLPNEIYQRICTTQDFCISFELFKVYGNDESRKSLEKEQRLYHYMPPLNGWSLQHLNEQVTQKELLVLYKNRDNTQFYDLINPERTTLLVDAWFQKLLNYSTESIEHYL